MTEKELKKIENLAGKIVDEYYYLKNGDEILPTDEYMTYSKGWTIRPAGGSTVKNSWTMPYRRKDITKEEIEYLIKVLEL